MDQNTQPSPTPMSVMNPATQMAPMMQTPSAQNTTQLPPQAPASDNNSAQMHKMSEKISQILGLFYFFVASVLLLRFVFSLFAADRTTPFANFVYSITTPFMFLFENMFGGPVGVNNYQLESEIFVALIVYALIFFGLGRLVKILLK